MSEELSKQGHMLHLKLPTDPRWADMAGKSIEGVLVDHAYCEQKAASSCISLIVTFPELTKLVETLTPIVAEEWNHFERVLEQLKKRGYTLGRMRKDEYVNQLMKHIRKSNRDEHLIDRLLIGALIEARSCERFKMLWQNIEDEELQKFYYELMVSEAGHYVTFIELAREYQTREVVDKRWQEFLEIEADILRNMEVRGDRMH
ncbi:tRNA-(ms[2]io[6]A)-hydroxylase [Limibacter armeniacum]|uniref:tRNA-(ms[2]io[6]A)-hydroxylase n=1 Tax=Limibacter armeniacum TaxID=466084 RepID=UPI002FE5154E